jgi:hypothetical protein
MPRELGEFRADLDASDLVAASREGQRGLAGAATDL